MSPALSNALTVETPWAWDDNPSGPLRRWSLVLLALLGAADATYLALYQVGTVAHVWEPLFGNGSEVVLHSSVSRWLPIPDAALGTFGYLVEAVLGAVGGRERWRTRPYLVFLYAGVVALFAAASIGLLVMQAVVFRAWCTLCVASALISLLIAALAIHEPRASWHHVMRLKSREVIS